MRTGVDVIDSRAGFRTRKGLYAGSMLWPFLKSHANVPDTCQKYGQ